MDPLVALVFSGPLFFVMMVLSALGLIKKWAKDPCSDWSTGDSFDRFMVFIGAMLLSLAWPVIMLYLLMEWVTQRDVKRRQEQQEAQKVARRQELMEIAEKLQVWLPLTKSQDATEKEIAKDIVASLKARKKELS